MTPSVAGEDADANNSNRGCLMLTLSGFFFFFNHNQKVSKQPQITQQNIYGINNTQSLLENWRGGNTSKPNLWGQCYPNTKTKQRNDKKRNYRRIMNTEAKILNKILANQIRRYTKRITQPNQVGFHPGIQDWFNAQKVPNLIPHINRLKRKTIWWPQ